MKRALVILACTIVWSFVAVQVSFGAVDGFLLIQGLQGESTFPGRTNWTNISSYSSALGLPSALGVPPGTAKVLFQPLAIVKLTDSISPALAMAAASGLPFSTAVVEIVKTTGATSHVFLKLELFDVRVAAYSTAGRSQGEVPTEEVKLSYSRIRWTAFKFNPATGQPVQQSPSVGGWDLAKNQAF